MTDAQACRRKRRFPNSARAKAAIRTVKRYGARGAQDKKPHRAYQCPHCHGWHLTSDYGDQ